ncbi:GlxA family transcriptional regulator [Lipingzhangella sp. LS1_29]|uniref:GlxA family transcriptional regulator n=1 Tax=Lipingzhangella rawalii TaxID=2055835 RepID=A0ABU2HBD2_9ACTN|nr:GlxA family transcriptional regulator [Lipingzhangella rawalii]MDS1272636.1 GlxA family transcriptional regulator [Lipingzhangella rawalii]
MRSRTVLILLFEDVQSLDITGPLEVFTGANSWCAARGTRPAYAPMTASPDAAPIRTSSGLRITPDADLHCQTAPDLLLVPGGAGTRHPPPKVLTWLREQGAHATRLISVCTGAFLLAEAGLLAGRRATTHWAHCHTLANRFPEVTVATDPIFVRDGHIATSAGVTAGIDLTLSLVDDDLGSEAALAVARNMVMFLRRPGSQAQFSAQLAVHTARSPRMHELQQWIAEHPEADLSVEALARRTHLSARHFARAFTSEIGMSPGRYVDLARIESARRRFADSDAGVAETARACGYGTPEALRRAFLRRLGVGPSEYRERFRCPMSRCRHRVHRRRGAKPMRRPSRQSYPKTPAVVRVVHGCWVRCRPRDRGVGGRAVAAWAEPELFWPQDGLGGATHSPVVASDRRWSPVQAWPR